MADTDTGTAAAAAATAAATATTKPRAELTDAEKLQFWKKHSYFDTLPDDIEPMRRLLAAYSHMPADAVDEHLYKIRDKLWAVYKYPCIGRFSFLDLGMVRSPYYQEARQRLLEVGNDERLLDLACCVGQVLRQLVHEGVDPRRLYGADLHREFIDLGYELFGDGPGDKTPFTFFAGDILADDGSGPSEYDALVNAVTAIHAANFFHLFTWADQVKAAVRMVGFLHKPDKDDNDDAKQVRIFGAQLAHRQPGEHGIVPGSTRMRYLHDAASFQRLWDEVSAATGTRWRSEMAVQRDGVGSALTGNANVMYVRFGVWREGERKEEEKETQETTAVEQ